MTEEKIIGAMMKRKINLGVLPFGFLLLLFIIFSIIEGIFRMHNIKTIIDTMIPLCIGGYGMLFVISGSSRDMSAGSNWRFPQLLGDTGFKAWKYYHPSSMYTNWAPWDL